MRRDMEHNFTYGLRVLCDPHRGEALFCDQQVDELAADEVLDLAADEWHVDLDVGLELKPRAAAGFCRGEHRGAAQRRRRADYRDVDGGCGLPVADRGPCLLANNTEVAAVELRHHAGQPVDAQPLRRDYADDARWVF